MKTRGFDERQLKIRGEIFFHGLMTALTLLLVNAFFLGMDVHWASGFQQNILIIIFTGMVLIVEAILRDAFFGMGQMRWPIIGAFGVVAMVLLVLGLGHAFQGGLLAEGGRLTEYGFYLVYAVMPISVTVAGVIKEVTEKYKKNE